MTLGARDKEHLGSSMGRLRMGSSRQQAVQVDNELDLPS